MKRVLIILLPFLLLIPGAKAACPRNPSDAAYVYFYQHQIKDIKAGKGGHCASMQFNRTFTDATPVDEFKKYGLQDHITTIRYRLPKGYRLTIYSGRFWKRRRFLSILPQPCPAKNGLHGTGKDEWVDLTSYPSNSNIPYDGAGVFIGDWNNTIRSARITAVK